jgi:hypothetical protein
VETLENRLVPSTPAALAAYPVPLSNQMSARPEIPSAAAILVHLAGPPIQWDPPLGAKPPEVQSGPRASEVLCDPPPGSVPPSPVDGPQQPPIPWDPSRGERPPDAASGSRPFNPYGPEPYRLWERGPDGNFYPLGQDPPGSVPLGSSSEVK